MQNDERIAFNSLLLQLESRNNRIKDLEKQLDNFFIVSHKYYKLKQALRKLKIGCTEVYTRTNESKRLKKIILEIIKEVEDV